MHTQLKNLNLELPYDFGEKGFFDDWYAVEVNYQDHMIGRANRSRSMIDLWCRDHIGLDNPYEHTLKELKWYRFVGTPLWLFKNENDVLHFMLKWRSY